LLKLNIYDPFTDTKLESITFPNNINTANVDEYLKTKFTDMNIWQLLPGNTGKQMTQEEYFARQKNLRGEK